MVTTQQSSSIINKQTKQFDWLLYCLIYFVLKYVASVVLYSIELTPMAFYRFGKCAETLDESQSSGAMVYKEDMLTAIYL